MKWNRSVRLAHGVGAALATDRLVSRGCRRVVTIAGPSDVPAAQDRLTGFRQAMARHGQAYVPRATSPWRAVRPR